MNREIKFRAWNEKIWWRKDWKPCKPEMEYRHFVIYPESGGCEFPQWWWDLWWEAEKGMTLMQYTWLKDKNWVEIYEGDIVKKPTWMNWEFRIVKYWVMEIPDNEMYWSNTVCGFYLYDIHDTLMKESHFDNIDEYEIIWNIYENPDLLPNK